MSGRARNNLDIKPIENELARFKKIAGNKFAETFMTAPSPGIISSTMLNAYYDTHDKYLTALSREMRNEYLAINKAGLLLQIDAPDLAWTAPCSTAISTTPVSSRRSSVTSPRSTRASRAFRATACGCNVCYGNWEGPHIHDIPLAKILPALYQAKVGALSIEFSNPRHAHEYSALKQHPLPKDMLLIPGVVETTSNFVEHPEVVARRIEEAVSAVGDRERVIASTDCGFGTFTNREWVIEPAVWLKLRSIREGADIALGAAVGPQGSVRVFLSLPASGRVGRER